jgi:hypothetical protein
MQFIMATWFALNPARAARIFKTGMVRCRSKYDAGKMNHGDRSNN